MFNIADYLKKFTRIEGDSLLLREAVRSSFHEICGIENVSYDLKKGVIYLKMPPVAKSLVYTRKDALLSSIRSKAPNGNVYDIR